MGKLSLKIILLILSIIILFFGCKEKIKQRPPKSFTVNIGDLFPDVLYGDTIYWAIPNKQSIRQFIRDSNDHTLSKGFYELLLLKPIIIFGGGFEDSVFFEGDSIISLNNQIKSNEGNNY